MRFEVRRYRGARWDAEVESHVLGAHSEVVRSLEAEYPTLAQQAVEQLVLDTRTETSERWQRGKKVRLTTWRGTTDAIQAWQTADGVLALVVVREAA